MVGLNEPQWLLGLHVDVGDDVLELCARNAEANRLLYSNHTNESETEQNKPGAKQSDTQDVILVRELDWMKEKLQAGLLENCVVLCASGKIKCFDGENFPA